MNASALPVGDTPLRMKALARCLIRLRTPPPVIYYLSQYYLECWFRTWLAKVVA